jgi:parvulin-like peptidyl-prolyl isomerase
LSKKITEETADVQSEAAEAKEEKLGAAKDSPVASAAEVQSDSMAGDEDEPKKSVWAPLMPKDVKKAALKALATLAVLLLIVITVFGVLIYGYKSEGPIVKAFAQQIPYPVELVNGRLVSYYDYLFEVDANKRAYQNNAKLNNEQTVDFSTADGKKLVLDIKKHALDKLKSDVVTAQLADQNKVKVTDKDVDNTINDLYKRYGGKTTLLKTLKQIYDWNLDDLKSVVRKQLLSKDLETKITTDPKMLAQAKAKAQDVLKQIKAGGDFVALAKKYSQASDAATGGDLGTVTKSQLPSDIQKAVDAVQVGQVSDLIKTQYGYEIIKITEKTDTTIKGNHILIKTTDFTEYFNAQLKKAKSTVLIKL